MHNKYYENSQEYINRWVISYADFITMLLALFIVMYALNRMDINNVNKFPSSIGKAFVAKKVQYFDKEMDVLEQKRQMLRVFATTNVKIYTKNLNIENPKKQENEINNQINIIKENLQKDKIEFANIEKSLNKKFDKTDKILIAKESKGLIIRLNDTVLFDGGSDIIKEDAKITLDKLALTIKDIPNLIRIEGHTDNKPIVTKKFPSNWELSTARATNIVRYLINKHHFNPINLSAVGYGEYKPIKDNVTEQNRVANRRVDIVILSSTN